ncbi:MAG: NAD(P)-binding protein [Acutalibacteraceae bacterium]
MEQAGGEFTPPDPEPEVRTQRELYAGLVIAGAGGAGMTAAAEAVREGGATVLVLEQQDIIGGETLYEPVLTLSDGTLTSGYGMLGDLRAEVEEAGAELLTGVKLTGLEVTNGRVTEVRAESAEHRLSNPCPVRGDPCHRGLWGQSRTGARRCRGNRAGKGARRRFRALSPGQFGRQRAHSGTGGRGRGIGVGTAGDLGQRPGTAAPGGEPGTALCGQ